MADQVPSGNEPPANEHPLDDGRADEASIHQGATAAHPEEPAVVEEPVYEEPLFSGPPPVVETEVEERPFLEEDPLAARRSRAVLIGGLASLLLAGMGGAGTFLLMRDQAGAAPAQIAVGDGTTTVAPTTTPPDPSTTAPYVPLPQLPIPTTLVPPGGLPTTTTTLPRDSVPTLPPSTVPPSTSPTPPRATTSQPPSGGGIPSAPQVIPPAGISIIRIESSSASVNFPYAGDGGNFYSNTDSKKLIGNGIVDLAYSSGGRPVTATSGSAKLTQYFSQPTQTDGGGNAPIFLKAKAGATTLTVTGGTAALIEYWNGTSKLNSGTSTTIPAGTQFIAVFPQSGANIDVNQS